MAPSRVAVTVGVVAALVLSGCVSAPMASDEETREVTVSNGTLPVDVNVVYGRIIELVGSDPAPPRSIRVVDPQETPVDRSTTPSRPTAPPFWAAMGVTADPDASLDLSTLETGVTTGGGAITIYTGDNESDVIHYVLAHELVHYVQFENGRASQVSRAVDSFSTDGQFVLRSVLEGVAVYTTDEYIRRYVDTDETNSGLYRRVGRRLPPGGLRQYANSQYVFGTRYVEGRISSPSAADRIYRNPPTTSEQVIHGYAPDEEPARNLSVSVEANGWKAGPTDRLGEGFLRVALRNGLDGPTADRVAAGWGVDSLRTYRRTNESTDESFVWVLRWDDPANATEFVDGFRRYLDARGDRSGDAWTVDGDTATVRRVGPTTTVVLLGTERFVRETTVTGSDGRVDVSLPPVAAEVGSRSDDPPASTPVSRLVMG